MPFCFTFGLHIGFLFEPKLSAMVSDIIYKFLLRLPNEFVLYFTERDEHATCCVSRAKIQTFATLGFWRYRKSFRKRRCKALMLYKSV